MKRHTVFQLSSIIVLISLVVSASSATAAPIYSQTTPAEPIGAFSSNDTTTAQKVADNFILSGSGPVTVRSLRFIGGYTVRNPPPTTPPIGSLPSDNFRIVILEDDGGSPGIPLLGGEFLVGPAIYRTGTNNQLLNGFITPIEYKVDLATGLTIDTNTDYWITILNNTGPDFSWQWARASGAFDPLLASTVNDISTGPWNAGNGGAMWFELNDQNVPEPQTLTILIASLALPVLTRKRPDQQN